MDERIQEVAEVISEMRDPMVKDDQDMPALSAQNTPQAHQVLTPARVRKGRKRK